MAKSKRKSAKEIIGANMREALSKLKKEFGNEAIIYSQEKKNGKIHLLAGLSEDDVELESSGGAQQFSQTALKNAQPTASAQGKEHWILEQTLVDEVKQELAEIKTLLRDQVAGLAWQDGNHRSPIVMSILRKLDQLDFDMSVAQALCANVGDNARLDQAIKQVLVNIYDDIMVDMNVFNEKSFKLFVGPTGIGKTNLLLNLLLTITKENILKDFAVVSVNQKIIGLEESKIFNRVFDVPSYYCDTPKTLQATLEKLKKVSLVFIDFSIPPTSGDFTSFGSVLSEFENALDINYVTSGTIDSYCLSSYLDAFNFKAPKSLSLTKADEKEIIGGGLSSAIYHKLPLRFLNASNQLGEGFSIINKEHIIQTLAKQLEAPVASEPTSQIWKFSETIYHGEVKQRKAS